jgi:3-methyladenine DNA glycosylase AlkC
MKALKFTLLADGSSDKTLIPVIKWTLDDLFPKLPSEGQFADFSNLPVPPKSNDLKGRAAMAIQLFPCDILFVHRDCESKNDKDFKKRLDEISDELGESFPNKYVRIVPITMMEAWFLIDELAIRRASGNRNSPYKVELPKISKLETINDPKEHLHDMLTNCSGDKKFNPHKAVHTLADNIEAFSKLRQLKAFKAFEQELREKVEMLLET